MLFKTLDQRSPYIMKNFDGDSWTPILRWYEGMFLNTISAGFFSSNFVQKAFAPPPLNNVKKICRIGVNLPLPFFFSFSELSTRLRLRLTPIKRYLWLKPGKELLQKNQRRKKKSLIVFHCKFWQMGGTTQEQFTILRLTFIQGLSFDTSGVGPNPAKHTTFQIMR